MVKQRGLGHSNRKWVTQTGTNIKKQNSHKERSSGQHSKQSGVLPCRNEWLGWRRVGSAATPTAQRLCRRTGCAATPLYGTATSFRTGQFGVLSVGIVLGPDVVSLSPDGRRSARTVVVGARSVTRPLTGDNCAVRAHCRELRRLPITARGRHVWLFSRVAWETMSRIVQR